MIVIPTRPTSKDIEPLWRMKNIVRDSGKPVVYVINGWNRYRASKDFLAWFRGAIGEDAPVFRLPQSEQFVQAAARQRAFERQAEY